VRATRGSNEDIASNTVRLPQVICPPNIGSRQERLINYFS